MSDPTATIRALRMQSNEAIAAHDVERTVALMDPDITVAVAGGPVLHGREASRVAFIEQFTDRAFITYVRSASQVVMRDASAATERGQWRGRWKMRAGIHEQGGSYVAEWRHGPMGWLIASETFLEAEDATG